MLCLCELQVCYGQRSLDFSLHLGHIWQYGSVMGAVFPSTGENL